MGIKSWPLSVASSYGLSSVRVSENLSNFADDSLLQAEHFQTKFAVSCPVESSRRSYISDVARDGTNGIA